MSVGPANRACAEQRRLLALRCFACCLVSEVWRRAGWSICGANWISRGLGRGMACCRMLAWAGLVESRNGVRDASIAIEPFSDVDSYLLLARGTATARRHTHTERNLTHSSSVVSLTARQAQRLPGYFLLYRPT
ncbi:hypothetical protein EJ04DRAFT_11600 [Polyplosphaeria fusca]|uniref:Uncharacterized protein n=1 Tax=Polyplosphaeria fusca TaxID=682080 RepID=A0A9P4QUL8_9PLEO|nr:hypothetical protein EJ04DRAFT_11600 [Polyplosphaeria fusca]